MSGYGESGPGVVIHWHPEGAAYTPCGKSTAEVTVTTEPVNVRGCGHCEVSARMPRHDPEEK